MLAPIDAARPLDAKLTVRCADCHSAAPLENVRPLAENPPPLGRCTHCHVAHVKFEERGEGSLISIQSMRSKFGPEPTAEVAFCAECHRVSSQLRFHGLVVEPAVSVRRGRRRRRAGKPGRRPARGRHRHGAAARVDVPVTQRPFAIDAAMISDPARPGRVERARIGAGWVRVAPLFAVRATAP